MVTVRPRTVPEASGISAPGRAIFKNEIIGDNLVRAEVDVVADSRYLSAESQTLGLAYADIEVRMIDAHRRRSSANIQVAAVKLHRGRAAVFDNRNSGPAERLARRGGDIHHGIIVIQVVDDYRVV